MYIDYFLKFDSEEQANSILFDGENPKYASIDVIGTIYKPTGKIITNEEGDFPEMKPIPGWHVNIRHPEPAEELNEFSIYAATPVRNWF